ncbi:TonB-dependent receptor [Hahella sp. KA22]|uniref:TonB-dependent receptor plug domain-containing protein n=1 Tax=Hahella sp. KA22 TaxID=1628392 RepID=UPI000FDCFF0D|nr:TonB-dependent receptor [Hahella sp. KA22]AZZ92033.1 TonB-dependent receptor [Hahella sp. KA22]QAY55404.1 TonB-dependent receptor [Hahella sp. KA22]
MRLITVRATKERRGLSALVLACASSLAHAVESSSQNDMLAAADISMTDWQSAEIPVVLTPARLKQPRSETPATVTVLDAELLHRLGVRNLHDAFRLVPGMTVGSVSSNLPSVSYHGTNANEQRRLQVLVDGRSVYNPNLADVDWLNIPVALEDIARIEITRGPNAAAYGANSFLAIVNIITRHPYDTHGTSLTYWDGSNGYNRYHASYGGGGDTLNYRVSVNGKQDDGFDRRANGEPFIDSYDLDGFNLSANVQLGPRDILQVQAGLLNGDHEYHPDTGDGQTSVPDSDERDRFVSVNWRREVNANHFFQVQAYAHRRIRRQDWTNCNHPILFSDNLSALYAANQRFGSILIGANGATLAEIYANIVSGPGSGLGSAEDDAIARTLIEEMSASDPDAIVCGRINLDIAETRQDIELQDTYTFSDEVRLVSGLSFRKDSFYSETYFNGGDDNYLQRAFFNLEYRPQPDLGFNLGGMAEHDQANGGYFSPRGAMFYHLTPNQTLRLVVSHAVRTPDTYEQSVAWSFVARDLDPPLDGETEARSFLIRSPGGLDNEKIVSREIGYYLNYPEWGLETDIKVFRDNMWDLISAPLQYFSFEPENNLKIEQTGLEIETTYSPSLRDTLRATYAYLDQDEEYTGSVTDFYTAYTSFDVSRLFQIESRMSARHSGSFAWLRRINDRFDAATAYYLADAIGDYVYERADLTVSYHRRLGRGQMELSAKLEHYLSDDPIMYRDNVLDDRTHLFLSANLKF